MQSNIQRTFKTDKWLLIFLNKTYPCKQMNYISTELVWYNDVDQNLPLKKPWWMKTNKTQRGERTLDGVILDERPQM